MYKGLIGLAWLTDKVHTTVLLYLQPLCFILQLRAFFFFKSKGMLSVLPYLTSRGGLVNTMRIEVNICIVLWQPSFSFYSSLTGVQGRVYIELEVCSSSAPSLYCLGMVKMKWFSWTCGLPDATLNLKVKLLLNQSQSVNDLKLFQEEQWIDFFSPPLTPGKWFNFTFSGAFF